MLFTAWGQIYIGAPIGVVEIHLQVKLPPPPPLCSATASAPREWRDNCPVEHGTNVRIVTDLWEGDSHSRQNVHH